MTVVEFDSPGVFPVTSETGARNAVPAAADAFLYSPNLLALEREGKSLASLQKGRLFLDAMAQALATEAIEQFNLNKAHLFRLFQQNNTPITAWNPLVLVFKNPLCLQGKNLSHIDLERVCLSAEDGVVCLERSNLQAARCHEADFTRVRLADADLTGADFRYADFREADLSRVLLIEADLSHAKLSFADLTDANLYSAHLNGTLARQTCFKRANFRKADLRYADFYQSDLTEARLQHTDLRHASLFSADLTNARLRQADLRKANFGFSNLTQARLQETALQGASFASANLSRADFRGCRLKEASFNRARFEGTQLMGVDLQGSDLSTCDELASSLLQDARFDSDTKFPEGFDLERHALRGLQCRPSHRVLYFMLPFLPHRCVCAPD